MEQLTDQWAMKYLGNAAIVVLQNLKIHGSLGLIFVTITE